jgi:hypothetical protein
MPQSVPIPIDLWRRLAALDYRADTTLTRRSVGGDGRLLTTGRNFARYWVVRITGRVEPK